MAAAPAGWPRDLPPPGTPEFDERVTGWLLDRGPEGLRSSDLRHLPHALARVVDHFVSGALQGMRQAYATARVELGERVEPADLARVLVALEAEGARLLQVQREVRIVGRHVAAGPSS
jgi:hypothetical protein